MGADDALASGSVSVGTSVLDGSSRVSVSYTHLRKHQSRERNRKLIESKKKSVLESEGLLACEACGFDFTAVYGVRGEGFVECHHTIPVSEMEQGAKTHVKDLALLCANCHRMIHRRAPWLEVEELRELLADQVP